MKFVLYSLNYSPELTGIGKYNGELAPDLAARGHDVSVVTAPPYYPEWQRHRGFKNRWAKTQEKGVSIYRSPLFVPKKISTIKRMLHLMSFAISSSVSLMRLLSSKPDVLFLVQPTLFCAPMALLFCKLTGAKAVMHIQDFEVDAMFGLGMSNGLVAKLGKGFERWCLKHFDLVSSISSSMLANAEAKGLEPERQLFFPNWSDTDFVTPSVDGAELRKAWGYSEQDKVVLYSGNVGHKQGLEIVLNAAEKFGHNSCVKFIIIGSGSYRAELETMAKTLKLSNVEFKPLQPWEDVPKILAMADVHLVVQKKGAADAVLPSKLTNILSAGGHALVTAEGDTELGRLAQQYPGIYQCVEPESITAFNEGLAACLAVDTSKPNTIARRYAIENLNESAVIDRFVEQLQEKFKL